MEIPNIYLDGDFANCVIVEFQTFVRRSMSVETVPAVKPFQEYILSLSKLSTRWKLCTREIVDFELIIGSVA